MRALSPAEARVLGVLIEKQATVPDSYPLSLNALVTGCNQKTARDPLMALTDDDVLEAIDGLKQLSLVFETSGSRVVRFEHNAARAMGVPSQAVALLATLVLRGPQTAAELRLNSERLHRFADISSVEAFLDELATRPPVRVQRLARAPGEREARWAHLLCGELPRVNPVVPVQDGGPTAAAAPGSAQTLRLLEERVAVLEAQVAKLLRALGASPDAPD